MKNKLVSVIMPTYNREKVITRAIKSVLGQTYKNLELLVIDDGSEDNTEQVVRAVADQRVCYIKLSSNKGACHARNQGLAQAKGEYIAFIDSDNVWLKNYLDERIKLLENSSPKVGAVFGYFMRMKAGEKRKIIPSQEFGSRMAECRSNKKLVQQLLVDNVIDTNTIVLKRKCVEMVNGFNENLRRLQDWEYFFRIAYFSGYRILFQENCLVKNYIQKDSITSNKNNKAYWDTKLYFFKQYKEIMKENHCLHEVFVRWCYQKKPQMDAEMIMRFFEVIKDDNPENVIILLKKKGLAGKEAYTNLHKREMAIIEIQNRWLRLKRQNIDIGNVLEKNGFRRVVIYGFGHLGKLLYEEIRESASECTVTGILDSKLMSSFVDELPITRPNKEYQQADAVIVTAIHDFEQIKKQYEKETPYISLKKIIEMAEKREVNRRTM